MEPEDVQLWLKIIIAKMKIISPISGETALYIPLSHYIMIFNVSVLHIL